VSATAPEATGDDSRGRALSPGGARTEQIGLLLRLFLAVAGAAGGVFLVLATTATIIDISIGTTGDAAGRFDTALSGADRHGPALIVIAVFAMVLLVAAAQGVRPAMVAVAACGVLVLGIAILSDARNIDDTGQLRQLYTGAIAGAGAGFYFETLGGALLLISGGGLLVLSGGSPAAPAGLPGPRTGDEPASSPAGDEAPAEPRVVDWFADRP
jgi:hypothetical protein